MRAIKFPKQRNLIKQAQKAQKRQLTAHLTEHHFHYLLEAIFSDVITKVGNAGQATIVRDLYFGTKDILVEQALSPMFRKNFVDTLFVQFLGVDKYLAIEILIEDELLPNIMLAWDDSVLYDSQKGVKTFLKLRSTLFNNPYQGPGRFGGLTDQ